MAGALLFQQCNSGSSERTPMPVNTNSNEVADKGQGLYKLYCTNCHGPDGRMEFGGAADLSSSQLSKEEVITIVSNGKGLMTGFKNIMTEEEIDKVAEYTLSLRKE